MPLRKTDLTSTRRFEDGNDYLVLRVGGLSKGEGDRVRDLTAAYKVDPATLAGTNDEAAMIELASRTAQANRLLFELLCQEWSLEGAPNGDAYAALDEESGRWVDDCIEQVLRERRERAVKNGRSSAKRSARGSSSARAAR